MTDSNIQLLGIYGGGGCGRGIMPIAKQVFGSSRSRLVFVDDGIQSTSLNQCPLLSYKEFVADSTESKALAIAIANSEIRERIAFQMIEDGITPLSVTHPTNIQMHDVEIAEGHLLSPYTVLTANIRIGKFFHANIHSYIEHDCRIGDFVTFAPGVQCNGHVVIEDHAYIGAGATIKQGREGEPLVIGKGATVGIGAVVTRSVAPGVTVVGNPARPL